MPNFILCFWFLVFTYNETKKPKTTEHTPFGFRSV